MDLVRKVSILNVVAFEIHLQSLKQPIHLYLEDLLRPVGIQTAIHIIIFIYLNMMRMHSYLV